MRQSGIEAKITRFHLRRRRPKQLMGFLGRLDGGAIVPIEKSGLQLSPPIEKFGQSQRRITCETMFGVRFAIVEGVEASKGRSQAAKRTYETQIHHTILDHEPKTSLLDEVEAPFHLRLNLGKGVAHG